MVVTGRSYHAGANLVVVCKLSTFSSIYRPQFVALHLSTNGSLVSPVQLLVGDEVANGPLPNNGSSEGIVMTGVPEVTIHQVVLPTRNRMGMIRGTAIGNVFYTTSGGNIMGCTIQFDFDAPLGLDG